ncbi:MAG TPA: hypothetical protein VEK56_18945 [Vicinamibacterales bacterium]|nr:hypothetical protein [Vicinamibacterales bacterium]
MEERLIPTLRSKISRDQAVRTFTAGPVGWSRRAALGPLRSIADVYVPFRIYRVDLGSGRTCQTDIVGLDAITGSLDLYRFTAVPSDREVTHVQTSNHVPVALDESAAREIVESRIQRLAFQRNGFFSIRQLRVEVESAGELHVPYWIAFFGRAETTRLRVIDAVRGALEGAKVRRLLYQWLA